MAGQLNSFLDRLMQHVPADKRQEAQSTYSQLSDQLRTLEANEAAVRATAQKQNEWWSQHKDTVTENAQLKAELETARKGGGGMDANAIEQAIAASTAQALETGLGIATTLADLATGHLHEFGETLNTRQLAQAAIAAKLPVDQYYQQQVAERRQARQQADLEARLKAARDEGAAAGRQEVLNSLPGKQMPFPGPSQANGPTTLAGLRKPADGQPNPFSLEAAVATATAVAAAENQ